MIYKKKLKSYKDIFLYLLNYAYFFRNFSKVSHSERQYLNLINHLLLFGEKEKGRNGNVITTTGTGMRFCLENNSTASCFY